MSQSIRDIPKSAKHPGRPRTTGRGTIVGARWHAGDLADIDAYAATEGIGRAEAIRRLVRAALDTAPAVQAERTYTKVLRSIDAAARKPKRGRQS
jgi:hypothetical protein